jgi:hypothetical protein
MFLVAFGKTTVAHTKFYDSDIRVTSPVGFRSVRRYSDIRAIDCYDNGVVIRFESSRRIKILLGDDAQEFSSKRSRFGAIDADFLREPVAWI